MGVSKLKNLVIAALVLLNLFFIAVIAINTYNEVRSGHKLIEDACMVMNNAGIFISPDDVKAGGELRMMRTTRDEAAESAIAGAVLGPTVMTDQGVINQYLSEERGIAEFYSAGDFEVRLNAGVISDEGGPAAVAQGLLRDMKLEISDITTSGERGNETVTAVSAYKGARVFNCTIDFVFSGGDLRMVKGRYIAGAEPLEGGNGSSLVSTALLGFLSEIRNEDRAEISCTQILGVEAGYQHRVTGSFGESEIVPAWLITTDTGRYIVDSATGDVRAVA